MADQGRIDEVVLVEHSDDVGDVVSEGHVWSRLVAAPAVAGERHGEDRPPSRLEQLYDWLPAPLADPGAVDEDDRRVGQGR